MSQYEVLLCADEVITGFGRTGTMFGLEHWGVEPDLVQYAKAITSGYFPLGGIGVSDEDRRTQWTILANLGCTLTPTARTLSDVRSLAECWTSSPTRTFPGQARDKGNYLMDRLNQTIGAHPNVGEIRGLGLMVGIELVEDKDARKPFEPSCWCWRQDAIRTDRTQIVHAPAR